MKEFQVERREKRKRERKPHKREEGQRDFFKMRRFPLVAFALLLLLLAVAASVDTLPPPAAVSSTGKDIHLPVDSTAELTGPRSWVLEGGREGEFLSFFFSLFSNARRRSKKQRGKKGSAFPALLESFCFVPQCVIELC